MAITLKTKLTMSFSVVVATTAVAKMEKQRESARTMTEEKFLAETGQRRMVIELYRSEKTNEEIFEILLRMGFREGFLESVKEFADEDFSIKGTQVAVNFTPKVPKVPAKFPIDCIHCRVLDGAGRAYKCATCRNVDEVK